MRYGRCRNMDVVEYRLQHACDLFTTLDVCDCMDVGWYERVSFSHSKDLLASISHSSHASSKSHSHTVPRSPTHTISVHTILVCTSTYSVLYVLLRIPYWMYLYVLNSTCTRTSSTYRSTYRVSTDTSCGSGDSWVGVE